jgi:hypothetical protein
VILVEVISDAPVYDSIDVLGGKVFVLRRELCCADERVRQLCCGQRLVVEVVGYRMKHRGEHHLVEKFVGDHAAKRRHVVVIFLVLLHVPVFGGESSAVQLPKLQLLLGFQGRLELEVSWTDDHTVVEG